MRAAASILLVAGCARWERPVTASARAALEAAAPDLDAAVLGAALGVRACAVRAGSVPPRRQNPRLGVIDYGVDSTEPRLWVFDLEEGALLHREWVAHGSGGGGEQVPVFSDAPGSHCSSVGAFVGAETYLGKHGLSLRLDGLEPGFNGNARLRDIVVHGAAYVSEAHIEAHGRLGRSWGCPAVRPAVSEAVVRHLAGGAMLLAWAPDPGWQAGSDLLACARGLPPQVRRRTFRSGR